MTDPAQDPKKDGRPQDVDKDGYAPCIKTTAATMAGVSLGVIGGVAGIAAAAVFEIILPVSLCLWATGLAGGAIGLLLGLDHKPND